jgi:hypothetical protein
LKQHSLDVTTLAPSYDMFIVKSTKPEFFAQYQNSPDLMVVSYKAKLMLLKLIHLFAREVLSVKKLEIEKIKTT